VTAPTLLLVPHPIHATDLLDAGPAGGRPPTSIEWRCWTDGCGHRWWVYRPHGSIPTCDKCGQWDRIRYDRRGIALRLDGKPCALGVARLAEVADADTALALWDWVAGRRFALPAHLLAKYGTLLRLDAGGRVLP